MEVITPIQSQYTLVSKLQSLSALQTFLLIAHENSEKRSWEQSLQETVGASVLSLISLETLLIIAIIITNLPAPSQTQLSSPSQAVA